MSGEEVILWHFSLVRPLLTSLELKRCPEILDRAFISIDTSSAEGKSLTCKRIQIHGSVEKYALRNAKGSCLDSATKSDSELEFPAVVTSSFGKGRTAAFLYDLPRNIAYTRQGNPEFAGIEKDSYSRT